MSFNRKENIHSEACYCGKCIKRRHTKTNFPGFPYSKDIETSYGMFFKEKKTENNDLYFNVSKNSSIDKGFKVHLSSGLISSQKLDYRPYKIISHEYKKEKKIDKVPFFGSSSYDNAFVDWRVSHKEKKEKCEYPKIEIPLRGKSNYNESYVQINDPVFKKIASKPISNFDLGKKMFIKISTSKDNYKSIDYESKKYYLAKSMDKRIDKLEEGCKDFEKMTPFKSQYSDDFSNLKIKSTINKCVYDKMFYKGN